MSCIYLSTPNEYSDSVDDSVVRFLKDEGYSVLQPRTELKSFLIHNTQDLIKSVVFMIMRCQSLCVYGNWQDSRACRAEVAMAQWADLAIFYYSLEDSSLTAIDTCDKFGDAWDLSPRSETGGYRPRSEHVVPGHVVPGEDITQSEDILDEAKRITSGDRQGDYGPPNEDFSRTAELWTALWRHKLKDEERFHPHEVADGQIALKLSRKQKSPTKRDHYTDIAGYARCGWQCINPRKHI